MANALGDSQAVATVVEGQFVHPRFGLAHEVTALVHSHQPGADADDPGASKPADGEPADSEPESGQPPS